jgi:hypothetical protein
MQKETLEEGAPNMECLKLEEEYETWLKRQEDKKRLIGLPNCMSAEDEDIL